MAATLNSLALIQPQPPRRHAAPPPLIGCAAAVVPIRAERLSQCIMEQGFSLIARHPINSFSNGACTNGGRTLIIILRKPCSESISMTARMMARAILKSGAAATTTGAAQAETSSGVADVVQASEEVSAAAAAVAAAAAAAETKPDLQSIAEMLGPDGHKILADVLSGGGGNNTYPRVPVLEAKDPGAGGGTGNNLMIYAAPFMGAVAKGVVDNAFKAPGCSILWLDPYVGAACRISTLCFLLALAWREKRPTWSMAMVRCGGVATASAILVPMAVSLPPAVLLAASIVMLAVALS